MLLNKPEIHLWYLRVIIICYLTAPVVVYLIRKNKKVLFSLLFLIFICTFCYNLYQILNFDSFPTTSMLSYSCYLIYFFGGFLINTSMNERQHNIGIWSLVFFVSIFCCVLTLVKFDYFLWYDNIFILFASISFFIIIMSLYPKGFISKKNEVNNLITQLSNMTFGVFLIHMFILRFLLHLNDNGQLQHNWWQYYALIVLTYLLSCIAVLIVSKISRRVAYLLFRYK